MPVFQDWPLRALEAEIGVSKSTVGRVRADLVREGKLPHPYRGNRAMAAAVKARAAKAGLAVTKSTIQLHGAIGFTDEHDIGLYLRRAMALAPQYGNQAAQAARYAALSGALEA